ncbi:MAG TPA: hypothetical protein VFP91_10140 [Vicinamibacterales bacterium]|nr:hypothetical protein [Vicinamibacterales bacterium]
MPSLKKANWHVQYGWSESSGLRLGVCEYQGIRVIHSASVPFVYVNYEGDSSGPFTDELKSRKSKVEIRDIMFGFDLKVTYDYYGEDYQYEHVWRFHDDGQFGSTIVIQGPGEEIDGHHTYHLPFRYDLDISGASGDSFQRRRADGGWEDVVFEGRQLPMHPWAPHFDWRVIDKSTGRSAAIRPRARDNAELWALRYSALESWGSWGATGSGAPGSPGSVPAVYDNGQMVQNTDIVVWYIAHIPSVERVTACGPWFKLTAYPPPERNEDDDHGHDH